jgi:hypothetical protein
MALRTLALITLLVASFPTVAAGQSPFWLPEIELEASDGGAFDDFGEAVALADTLAVVGAPRDIAGSGSVYVFARSGAIWTEQAKLRASDSAPNSRFGISVAISGETLVVGADRDDAAGGNAGSAYVFVRSGTAWSEQAKLVAGTTGPGDYFGTSVDIDGDTVVVGANQFSSGSGAAYVFVRSGTSWSEQANLTPAGVTSYDSFGQGVAVSGDTAIVGASRDDTVHGVQSGSIFVFTRVGTSWSKQGPKLFASDASTNDWFGRAVSLSANRLVAGAFNNYPSGAAYVFVNDGTSWSEEAKLTASGAKTGDRFGLAVSISGDRVAVGNADEDRPAAGSAGAAYLFARSGSVWSEATKLVKQAPELSERLGHAVAVEGTRTLAGLPGATPSGVESGAAIVFAEDPVYVNYCTPGTSASGCLARVSASGAASASAASGFTVAAADVEGQKNGMLIYGVGARMAAPWGGGSLRCFEAPVRRGGLLAGAGTAGACDGTFVQDLNARWCPSCPRPDHNPGAGNLVRAQLWYRDPANGNGPGSGLSDALEALVLP